ncbi:MAG TPA: hypothetical protein VK550_08195 [Polyangiaceae bacterium]|nr:hypothetical protein [Polyangiaceae bacterium]
MLRSRLETPDEWAVVLTGAVGVFGMGIQNALTRDVLRDLGAMRDESAAAGLPQVKSAARECRSIEQRARHNPL